MSGYKVFLSAVSSEFKIAREEIASDLRARGLTVKEQKDFRQEFGVETTLAKMDAYIAECAAVVHVAGRRSGGFPGEEEARPWVAALPAGVARASYTQFEYYLALRHGRHVYVFIARDDYPRDQPKPSTDDEDEASQAAHVARLKKRDRTEFSSTHELCRAVLRLDWPTIRKNQPRNLPYVSLGSLFKGRAQAIEQLHTALEAGGGAALAGRALHGLGGIGKTRLAVEYAHAHAADYSALLFLHADSAERLNASLAELAGPDILDLPEKEAREDAVKIPAALNWLDDHPGWLTILDNVDDKDAVAAAAKLLARLKGGKVLITGRAGAFPPGVKKIELATLDEAASVAFLLERTEDGRAKASDDEARARELARELGGLALALEQAGAQIAADRIGFARYLKLWRETRETVLAWFDKDLTSYDHDTGLAATWATSVDRLTSDGRRLLERLAFLGAEPIPDDLLDVAVPGEAAGFDAHAACANLFAYSLISRVDVETGKTAKSGFAVHRLVQDFTRRGMSEARRDEALREALAWVNAGFVGNPGDVRTWPALDPLAAHALAAGEAGDAADIGDPTARLFNELGVLFRAKARHAEGERVMRRALALNEASYGPNHPAVAIRLNNLASLLQATNRLAEAEPLMRRALDIDEASYGPNQPRVAIDLNNLASLLQDTNRLAEAEPLKRRALAIFEASFGPDHPNVATSLNNLARLLQDTNQLAEAEPLMRRALDIDEASYGPDHPGVARDLNNLATLLYATGRVAEAEPAMRRALDIDEASYGSDHPRVAIRLNNLAQLLKAANRLAEAEPLMRRALAIDEASYGPDHPDVARDLNNLASLLCDTNRLAEAEPLMPRALAILEMSYGADHPRSVTARGNLARLLAEIV